MDAATGPIRRRRTACSNSCKPTTTVSRDHLWSGITTVRPGAGVAVVGDPRQVADTLSEFVDVGCTHFCLSGYPHDEEAKRFGRDVMPIILRKHAALRAS